jgi:hypothetical protein
MKTTALKVLSLGVVMAVQVGCGGAVSASLGPEFAPSTTGTACASGVAWTGGTNESAQMNPGVACRACHLTQDPRKAYFFMGTVYSSAHEVDLCAAANPPSDAVVEILDTNDVVKLTLKVNAAGNFYSSSTSAGVPTPYRARVRANGKVNVMGSAQTDGDCNSCHTAAGFNGAPGRVTWPL